MMCESLSPPVILHPREITFETVTPAEPCRHLHPCKQWWEMMGVLGTQLPSPVPDRCLQPHVSLQAIPSDLGVWHLWGGVCVAAGGVPPSVVVAVSVALLRWWWLFCASLVRWLGVHTGAAASSCRWHWLELGLLQEISIRKRQVASYTALHPDAN